MINGLASTDLRALDSAASSHDLGTIMIMIMTIITATRMRGAIG